MRSGVSDRCGEYPVYLVNEAGRPDIHLWRLQQRIDTADRKAGAGDPTLRVETSRKGREREAKRGLAGVSENENWRCRRVWEKRRLYESRRTAAELLLYVRGSQPVVEQSIAAAHDPIALAGDIPGRTKARAPQVIDGVEQSFRRLLRVSVGNLLVCRVTRAEVEISEHGCCTLGPGISAVVVAKAQIERQSLASLPVVFCKQSKRTRCRIPIPELLRSRLGVVHNAALVCGGIRSQFQQIIECKLRLRPRTLERLHVISIPPFIPELEGVGATHMCEYVAPVVVVLDEIALGKTDAVRLAAVRVDSVHGNRWNCVVLGTASQNALYPVVSESRFIQRIRREGVNPRPLQSNLPRVVQGREVRHW